jgi:hypothetical protein
MAHLQRKNFIYADVLFAFFFAVLFLVEVVLFLRVVALFLALVVVAVFFGVRLTDTVSTSGDFSSVAISSTISASGACCVVWAKNFILGCAPCLVLNFALAAFSLLFLPIKNSWFV